MIFVSKRMNHQLWLRPNKERRTASGWIETDAGFMVQFEAGMYETNDEDIVDALIRHPEHGVVFKLYDGRPPSETELYLAPVHDLPLQKMYNRDGTVEQYVPIPVEEKRGEPKEPLVLPVKKELPPKKVGSPRPLTAAEVAERAEQGKKTFACKICGAKFHSTTNIKIHKEQVHRPRPSIYKGMVEL